MTRDPTITIELSSAVTWMLGLIATLIAIIGFFLHRELKANDQAHRDLRGDIKSVDTNLHSDIKSVDSEVKKLLAGDVAWIKTLLDRLPK